MRIGIVSGTFHPEAGGPPRYLLRLATTLVERGHEVVVVTAGDADHPYPYPFPVHRVSRRYRLPERMARMSLAVARRLRGCEVLFVNDHGVAAMTANLALRKPTVMKVVGDITWELAIRRGWTTADIDAFQSERLTGKAAWTRRVQVTQARQADRILTPAEYLKRLIAGWGVPAERIRVVRNAVDVDHYLVPPTREAAQAETGLAGRWLVTIARLTPWKGIDAVIRALSALDPAVGLCVVGDGPMRGALEALARGRGVSGRVRFAGEVAQEKTGAYLKSAEVCVLNSGYEGMSHVLLEAMHVGVPVCAAAKGGTPEMVTDGETGLLVPWRDHTALKTALARLTTDTALRDRLAANARRHVAGYTWEKTVSGTLEVFEEAITGR